MSHANAALTPRARSPAGASDRRSALARRAGRRAVSTCPGRPRSAGPTGTPLRARRAMTDRSVTTARRATRTPQPMIRKIVHLRLKQRLGPVAIAARLAMAASTVHAVLLRCRLNRLSHIDRLTGQPVRRYEHVHPGAMLHVDVKKFGNIPDGGGWRYVGRRQGDAQPGRDRPMHQRAHHPLRPDVRSPRSSTPSSMNTPGSATPRSSTTTPRSPLSSARPAPSPSSLPAASPSNASCPTTVRSTNPTPGATPAPNWGSCRRRPAPTAHRRIPRRLRMRSWARRRFSLLAPRISRMTPIGRTTSTGRPGSWRSGSPRCR